MIFNIETIHDGLPNAHSFATLPHHFTFKCQKLGFSQHNLHSQSRHTFARHVMEAITKLQQKIRSIAPNYMIWIKLTLSFRFQTMLISNLVVFKFDLPFHSKQIEDCFLRIILLNIKQFFLRTEVRKKQKWFKDENMNFYRKVNFGIEQTNKMKWIWMKCPNFMEISVNVDKLAIIFVASGQPIVDLEILSASIHSWILPSLTWRLSAFDFYRTWNDSMHT